tara:strand:+ start:6791 stop:7609 length:819 start_codon:yes stop_codon:yes gene_type:complete
MDHRIAKDMISSGMTPSGEKNKEDLSRTQYGSTPSPSKLMDAYKSMYEHHQKDKDGNTIPHEGEELNEGLGTVAGGTIGYQKGGVKGAIVGGTAGAIIDKMGKKKKPEVKEDKEQVNEILGMAAGALAAKAGLGLKGVMAAGAAGSAAGAAAKSLRKNPIQKKVSTISAGADLFDIVKGKLLDEGLTEKESLDVMLSLTLEEIDEALQLDEITAGLLMKAAKAAEVARGKAAVMGNKPLAMKKLGQGEKFYKGAVAKKKAAGQMGAGYKEGM